MASIEADGTCFQCLGESVVDEEDASIRSLDRGSEYMYHLFDSTQVDDPTIFQQMENLTAYPTCPLGIVTMDSE
jgi:hypothetical protein